jgi:hypothetical protein
VPTSLFAPDFQSVLDQAVNPPSPAAPFPSPEDWRDRWIYFLMLDRFNNPNAAPNHPPFDDPNFSDSKEENSPACSNNSPTSKISAPEPSG